MDNTFFNDYQTMLVEIEALKKDANNPFFKSKYVQLKDVLAEVKKVCVKNNFIFYQTPQAKDGKNFLKTTVQHSSGEKIEGEIEIVAKDNSDPQKIGGGITYMRRYSLTCMFGIEEEDDDGSSSSVEPTKQIKPKGNIKIDIAKEIKRLEPNLDKMLYEEFIKEKTGLVAKEENFVEILNKLKKI